MKKIISLILFSALIFTGCSLTNQSQITPTNDISTSATSSLPTENIKEKNTVEIFDFKFNPAVMIVKVGTTVKWVNKDSAPHIVASAGNFTSNTLNKNETYSFTFSQPGTYAYICGIHTYMKGIITVEN